MTQDITVQCDEHGMLRLGAAFRKKSGKRFAVVATPNKVILMPVPDDPVQDLAELGKPLRGLSIKQIKARARAYAVREALRGVRRR